MPKFRLQGFAYESYFKRRNIAPWGTLLLELANTFDQRSRKEILSSFSLLFA